MKTKYCKLCDTVKSLDEFTRTCGKNNYAKTYSHHSYCKVCNAYRAREWRKKNPNYRGTGRIKKFPKEDRLLLSAIRQRIVDAKTRVRKYKKPIPVDLTDQYLYDLFKTQKRKCALTGVILTVETGSPLALSLDQIDPVKGYVEGNVQWLAWCVNRAKGDLCSDDFYDMCEAVLAYRNVQRLSHLGVESSDSKCIAPYI